MKPPSDGMLALLKTNATLDWRLLTGTSLVRMLALSSNAFIHLYPFDAVLGFLANILAGAVNLVSPLIRWQARYRQQKPALAFLVLGYAWPLAGFGWTGPILAGLAGHALTSAGSFGAVITFTVASSTIVLLIFFLTLAIAMTQDALVNRMRIHTHSIKRWGGRILVGLGTWLVMLAVFADFFARVFSL